jgi:hypothetical protein
MTTVKEVLKNTQHLVEVTADGDVVTWGTVTAAVDKMRSPSETGTFWCWNDLDGGFWMQLTVDDFSRYLDAMDYEGVPND